ncbi:hypothetical protein [Streptomyces sp. NPDC059003]|uniref:hypothetical protein n=1 Tax=Streptomyces sp. NPDC059003 TaxID=3346691 RepID=UPI00368C3962
MRIFEHYEGDGSGERYAEQMPPGARPAYRPIDKNSLDVLVGGQLDATNPLRT